MIMKTPEGWALLWSLVSEKRCEEQKTQKCDYKVKPETCKCEGCIKPCPEWIEGLAMESFQSESVHQQIPMAKTNKGCGMSKEGQESW